MMHHLTVKKSIIQEFIIPHVIPHSDCGIIIIVSSPRAVPTGFDKEREGEDTEFDSSPYPSLLPIHITPPRIPLTPSLP